MRVDEMSIVNDGRRGKTAGGNLEYSGHESDLLGLNTTEMGGLGDIYPNVATEHRIDMSSELTFLATQFVQKEAEQIDASSGSRRHSEAGNVIEIAKKLESDESQNDKRLQGRRAVGRVGSGAERQRRYREKKKHEEKCVEEHLQSAMNALNCARKQNIDLKRHEDTMWSLLDSADGQNAEQKENIHIGDLYASVLLTFKKEVLTREKDSHDKANELQNVTQLIPRQNMYLLFRDQVNSLLKEYDASHDPVRKNSIAIKMKQLFGLRTHAIGDLAQKYPKTVLSHLIEGWVGEAYDQGIMPQDPHRFDNATVRTLVQHLNLSQEQIQALCRHWESFLSLWNQSTETLQKCISKLPANPNIQEICTQVPGYVGKDAMSDVVESNGLHVMMKNQFSMQAVTRKLENVSEEQILSVLGLAGDICTVLTPIQKARLCVFYSSAPNCMFLPYMLTSL